MSTASRVRSLFWLVLALTLLIPASASAGGKVTLCASDVQGLPGFPGLNLRDALIGGGTVTFDCPRGTTIEMSMTHVVARQALVDGGGSVALRTNSVRAMFQVSGDLILRGLALNNRFVGLNDSLPHGIVVGPGVLGLENCQVRHSASTFAIDAIRVHQSVFEDNDTWALITARVAIIYKSTFVRNDAMVLRSPRSPSPRGPTLAVVNFSNFSENLQAIWWVGELHVNDSSFADNDNGWRLGGAIRLQGPGTIAYTSFDRNRAANGGAIWVDDGALDLRRVQFHDNRAIKDGGAVGLAQGSVVSQYCTFARNAASHGGAVKLGTQGVQIALRGGANTFAQNEAIEGGAIHSEFGHIQLARVVFTGNTATSEGGAIFAARRGSPPGSAMLANSLLVRNVAPDGAAVSGTAIVLINSTVADNGGGPALALKPLSHFSSPTARGEFDLRNTVIANNSGGNCSMVPAHYDVKSNGRNLQFPGQSCGTAIAAANPLLDPFYVPSMGSPAFDGGDNAVCSDAPIFGKDVYGAGRPQGSACAIGAVEGDIDPRLFQRLLWRARDTMVHNYAALVDYLKK